METRTGQSETRPRDPSASLAMTLHELVTKLGAFSALDRVGKPLEVVAARLIPPGPVKDALSGTWLGHPLHPVLTDIAIGSFTSASLLDLVAGRRGRPSADALVTMGVAAALPTAASGVSDWSDTYGPDKRVGVAHAASNVAGVALYTASLLARLRGRRGTATALGLMGMGAMTFGAYLGGHLSFARGIGVNNAFWQHPPEEWTPVLDESDLADDTPVNVEANGATVLLYRRRGGELFALGSRCSHAGGPLHEGDIDADRACVTCPWHQSVFRLDDGSVVHGPASVPMPVYDVRVEGGKIEVRGRQA
jgi:nitrite reductase/ring-hydroxylating ferredoxin subunit